MAHGERQGGTQRVPSAISRPFRVTASLLCGEDVSPVLPSLTGAFSNDTAIVHPARFCHLCAGHNTAGEDSCHTNSSTNAPSLRSHRGHAACTSEITPADVGPAIQDAISLSILAFHIIQYVGRARRFAHATCTAKTRGTAFPRESRDPSLASKSTQRRRNVTSPGGARLRPSQTLRAHPRFCGTVCIFARATYAPLAQRAPEWVRTGHGRLAPQCLACSTALDLGRPFCCPATQMTYVPEVRGCLRHAVVRS